MSLIPSSRRCLFPHPPLHRMAIIPITRTIITTEKEEEIPWVTGSRLEERDQLVSSLHQTMRMQTGSVEDKVKRASLDTSKRLVASLDDCFLIIH